MAEWFPLVGGFLSGVGSWLGNKEIANSTAAVNRDNIRAQERINDLNWQRQMQFWHMTNEYNAPKSQMARYKEAGINPFTVGTNAGLASSPVYRAEAGQARASASVSNPMAHLFNFLGALFLREKQDNTKLVDTLSQELRNDNLRLKNDILRRQLDTMSLREENIPILFPVEKPSDLKKPGFFSRFKNRLTSPEVVDRTGKAVDYIFKHFFSNAIRYGVRGMF